MTDTPLTGRLEMTRVFNAAPERVFTHLTQTAHLLDWWGPEGTTIAEHDLDFSSPGPWSAHMIGPQGHGATVRGEVLRVAPPDLVELTLRFVMPDGDGPMSVIRFALHAQGAGTLLTLTQTGLDPAHIDDMMNKGWNSALARLAASLKA